MNEHVRATKNTPATSLRLRSRRKPSVLFLSRRRPTCRRCVITTAMCEAESCDWNEGVEELADCMHQPIQG